MRRAMSILAVAALFALAAVPVRAHVGARDLSPATTASSRNSSALRSFEAIPLSFEPNMGQADPRVRFLSRGPGYTLFLTPDAAMLSLRRASGRPSDRRAAANLVPTRSSSAGVITMRMVGSDRNASIEGMSPLTSHTNSFLGNDPSAWRTGIPNFSAVRYRSVYPGVDLKYYGNRSGNLEYDFTVAAGADPSRVRLAFAGVQRLWVDRSGALVLRLPGGDVRQPAPFAYQMSGGVKERVAARYVLRGSTVTFAVGARDVTAPLVIDPVISYSTYIGGSDYEEVDAIAVDSSGEAYLFGITFSTDFPLRHCNVQCAPAGDLDDYVAKLNRTGTALLWSTYIGGTGDDEAFGMTVDKLGNVYVAGPTLSTDFPTTPGAFQETPPGGDHDGFVAKIDSTGSRLVFSTYLGGSGHDAALTPAVDAAGDVYVVGDTNSTDLPVTDDAYQKVNHGGDCTIFNEFDPGDCDEGGLDMFVAELNPTGSGLRYLTYLGGTGDEVGVGLAVDRSGGAYVAMETTSADYPVTSGAYQTAFAGGDGLDGVNSDAAVTKLNSTGSALVYSTYLGGTGDDCFFFQCFVALDEDGHAYVASNSDSVDFPTTPGAFQENLRGVFDETVTKFNADGTALAYSTYIGGSDLDSTVNNRTIAVRPNGEAYVSGFTYSSDYPTVDPVQGAYAGAADATLSVLNRSGTRLVFSTYLGGAEDDAADMNIDRSGAAYVAGVTCSTDYPVTEGAFQGSLAGVCDGMVTKFRIDAGNSAGAVRRGPARRSSGRMIPSGGLTHRA